MLETNKKRSEIRCIYCDALLVLFSDRSANVDAEGYDRCPDGGLHRPVLTVEAIA